MSDRGESRSSMGGALWRRLWDSPQPATLQGADFRLLDVNDAYASLVGRSREELVGCDPIDLQPADDRDLNRAARRQWAAHLAQGEPPPPLQRRLIDAQGQEHWFWLALSNIAAPGEPPLWLSLVQDQSAEHRALQQAARAEAELAQWFGLSGQGMLVADETGLIVRSNPAFEALVERVPVSLAEASADLQTLLAWEGTGFSPLLQPGALPLERQSLLTEGDGRRRRLWARLACLPPLGDAAGRRVMAVVEDRSAEDERDLAQLEMGMLMDTASVGVATFDPSRGWLLPRRPAPAAAGPGLAAPGGGGALMGISRDLVDPASLPDYERLQQALRQGERTEVRYAVRHPELGLRWLLTRVEPGALAGGRATTSIVTLDVTEQEAALRRNDQLLTELTTILDSATVGIAYLRGPTLVRCNRRFERMLGLEPGGAAGASLEEIFRRGLEPLEDLAGPLPGKLRGPIAAQAALDQGKPFDAELALPGPGGQAMWVALSLRAAPTRGPQAEVVAVLTDVTRLKLQQTELEQSLRDRELMFSLSEVGIIYQRGTRIERANQAMAVLSGWSPSELATLDVAALYPNARECVAFEARIQKALLEQGRFSGERQLRRRDGSSGWVQVAVRPVDALEPEAGVICSFVDVDERHQARESLAQQAERTRAILNSVLVGIVTVSGRGIEWMNRSARRMFGGELADFVGEPISTVATPEPEHPLRRSDWRQRLREGQAETFECRLRGRDGREFWVVGNAVLTTGPGPAGADAAGELTFALLDIERRRQAEMNIAQAQASLQRVMETAPLAIALFDAQRQSLQQWNQTAGSFFQPAASAQELGATPAALCEPDQARWLSEALQTVAVSGQALQAEWQGGSPPRVWDCRFAPLDDAPAAEPAPPAQAAVPGEAAAPAPRIGQVLLVATDVTEQRAAERARLQAAIDQREVLVREVHHRIKNNLQGVAGLLQQNAGRHPELAAALTEAVGQVQAIAQVYGLQVGATGPLAVAGLLRAIAGSVQRTFGRAIQVEIDAAADRLLPEAEAIPVALTVNELLTNAIKHGSGTEVRCALQHDGDGVRLRVASVAQLPAGFELRAVRSGVSGLGLVRALLPRRGAQLALEQQGDEVVAEVRLQPPALLPVATEPAGNGTQSPA